MKKGQIWKVGGTLKEGCKVGELVNIGWLKDKSNEGRTKLEGWRWKVKG